MQAASTNSGFALLKNKDIYAILDGDTVLFTDEKSRTWSMPYLSGPTLAKICNVFGLPTTYDNRSRWIYIDELIDHCEKDGRCSDLLAYFFDIKQFEKLLSGFDASDVHRLHSQIVESAMRSINGILLFGRHELIARGCTFEIVEIGATVQLSTPAIKSVNREYIRDISNRASKDIDNGEFDSALTKARTLLEETFIYAMNMKGVADTGKGDIGALYKSVKDLYNMHADKDADIRINKLLSGLEKIVSSITEMRNKDSDAHGMGARRIELRDYHARLMVNSATAMADFVLSVAINARDE